MDSKANLQKYWLMILFISRGTILGVCLRGSVSDAAIFEFKYEI